MTPRRVSVPPQMTSHRVSPSSLLRFSAARFARRSKWSLAALSARNAVAASAACFPLCLSGCTKRLSRLNASAAAAAALAVVCRVPFLRRFDLAHDWILPRGAFAHLRRGNAESHRPRHLSPRGEERIAQFRARRLSPASYASAHAAPSRRSAAVAAASPPPLPPISIFSLSATAERNPSHTAHAPDGDDEPDGDAPPPGATSPRPRRRKLPDRARTCARR